MTTMTTKRRQWWAFSIPWWWCWNDGMNRRIPSSLFTFIFWYLCDHSRSERDWERIEKKTHTWITHKWALIGYLFRCSIRSIFGWCFCLFTAHTKKDFTLRKPGEIDGLVQCAYIVHSHAYSYKNGMDLTGPDWANTDRRWSFISWHIWHWNFE